MKLTSTAFAEGELLNPKYTGDGENISPPLRWQEVPAGTKSFALIYDDPDAPNGTWVHWSLYNLPATTTALVEDLQELPADTKLGINTSFEAKYSGAYPPSGTHRYIFHLYALDIMLNLEQPVDSASLKQAMSGHILETATLMGRYSRINN